jgi:nucleoside-diphosphate-sugar epimerase
MRIVVVGGSGFLGGALVNDLCSRGDEVTVLDLKPASTASVRPWGAVEVQHVQGDIRDLDLLLRTFRGADEVYHMAGKLGTSELERERHAAVEVNVLGSLNVFEAALHAGVGAVFLACKPNLWHNAYSITKEAAERFALTYARDHEHMRVRCLRYYNAYGPHQALGPVRKMIPTFAACALRGTPIPVFGDGRQTVDLILADDLARITIDYLRDPGGDATALDCGSGQAAGVSEIAHLMNAIAGNDAGVRHFPMRLGEPESTTLVADMGPLERQLGPLPQADLAEGLARTLAWYDAQHPHHIDLTAVEIYTAA